MPDLLSARLRCYTIRIESISDNLGGLASGYVILGTEVWPVLRSHTWLIEELPTYVPSHHSPVRKTLYLAVEGVVSRYVLKGLGGRFFGEPGSIRDYLSCLSPGSVSPWSEVGHVVVHTWFSRCSTVVPCHMTSSCETVDEVIEGLRRRYIGEYLGVRTLREASSIRHHLG